MLKTVGIRVTKERRKSICPTFSNRFCFKTVPHKSATYMPLKCMKVYYVLKSLSVRYYCTQKRKRLVEGNFAVASREKFSQVSPILTFV